MRIVHISTHDLLGGAARAAQRLHAGLRDAGVDSQMLVAWRWGDDERVQAVHPSGGVGKWPETLRRMRAHAPLRLFYRNRPADVDMFSVARTSFGRDLLKSLPACDVIHLHWVAQFVDYERFLPAAAARAPIVWTLHDMNPLTGGCHYSAGCQRFGGRCGTCPQLGSLRRHDLSRRIWRRKAAALKAVADHRLVLAAPSAWMTRLAGQSSLMKRFRRTTIPNGVDTAVFEPKDRSAIRRRFDLPAEARVVLFTAHNLANHRKGGTILTQAMEQLSNVPGLTLLTVGQGRLDAPPGVAHRHIAPVADEEAMADLYNLADVLAIPSAEDNLPNTMIEAMACGLPVAAFDAGGIGEAIHHGRTGMLAAPGDIGALAGIIGDLLSDEAKRHAMAAACRQTAERRFSLSAAAEGYTLVYRSLLEKQPA